MKLPRFWRRKERHPSIIANHERFTGFDQSRPVETYRFVAMDTELTGLNFRHDAIVSIGAVRIEGLRIIAGDNFFSYVRPKRSMPKVSTLIHRITPDQIENAPDLKTVLPDFIDYIGDSLLVGHFIGLDLSFMNRAAKTILGGILRNPCLDSMKLAQVYQERDRASHYDRVEVAAAYSLGALADKYGLPRFEQHDALGDAFQAGCLFIYLAGRMRSWGRLSLTDLHTATRRASGIF